MGGWLIKVAGSLPMISVTAEEAHDEYTQRILTGESSQVLKEMKIIQSLFSSLLPSWSRPAWCAAFSIHAVHLLCYAPCKKSCVTPAPLRCHASCVFSKTVHPRGWYARPLLSGWGRGCILIIPGGGLYHAYYRRSVLPLPPLGHGAYQLEHGGS